jgi:hypothetical protein
MIGLFKKKTKKEKLQKQYNKLMQEAFDLAKVNRRASDQKYMEAKKIMDEIEAEEGNSK